MKQTRVVEVNVTKKHIKDASDSIMFVREQNCWCPVALALYEQVMGKEYKIKRRSEYKKAKKAILFCNDQLKNGGATNPFAVAETIRINSEGVNKIFNTTGYHPSFEVEYPKSVLDFIITFDSGKPVRPFSFKLNMTN